MPNRSELLDTDLLDELRTALEGTSVIYTLAHQKPNWIVDIRPEGLLLETEKSRKDGSGSQVVPAWMLNEAWRHLRSHGSLTNSYLLNVLNVKRSSAVCAVLAQVPSVRVGVGPGINLELAR